MPCHPALRLVIIAIALLLGACAGFAPAVSPTPGIVPLISTPFPAYAAATPPAQLHEQPGGAPGVTLPRGTSMHVEEVRDIGDHQLWYRVTTTNNITGWLPAAAISLVADHPAAVPTPLPTVVVARPPVVSPTPRPMVVSGSGQGLFLRSRPGQGDVIRAYPDGTTVVPLGEETRLDGRRWLRVRAPDGREGWMAAEYLSPST